MSVARRSLQVVAFICTLVVGTASMAVIVTQTTWFKEWLRGFIVRQAEDYVNGRLSIGRLDGNLFFGVDLEDVDVTMNGKKVVDIKDVTVDYNMFTFFGGGAVLDDIQVSQPVLHIERTADGWNITQLIKARTPDPDEPKSRRTLEIGEIGITDGTIYFEDTPVGTSGVAIPSRLERLDASVGITSNEDELAVAINHLSVRAPESDVQINDLSGVVRRTANAVTLENVSLRTAETSLRVTGTVHNVEGSQPALDVRASSDKLTMSEIARLVPALAEYHMQPAFEITAKGPLDRMEVDLNVREANLGNVIGDLIVDANGSDKRVAGSVSMNHFNVAPLIPDNAARMIPDNAARTFTVREAGREGPPRMTTDITGQAQIDVALPTSRQPLNGTYAVQASRVHFAGYEARDVNAKGRIDGRVVRVNGSGTGYGARATANGTVNISPLALDLKGRATSVDMRNLPPVFANVTGVPSDLQFTYTLTGRGGVYFGDATLEASEVAGATIAPGMTAQFTVGGGAPEYGVQGQVSNLNVQEIGRGFSIAVLQEARFRSRLNTTFDVKGSGGGVTYPLTLDATGTAVDSEIFGASFPRMDYTTNFGGGDLRVRAIGQFTNLDPAIVLSDTRLEGMVDGAVDVDTTIRGYANGVTVDSFDASGRINIANSTLGRLKIDTGVIDGSYANRAGELDQLSIAGPDINITGQGAIALNETGASNLTAHIESPSLDRVGEIIGQPLKGAVVIDTTITGNATELEAAGTLQGSNIGYGESKALTLKSEFSLAVPDLTPARATIQAKSDATFVEAGGQRITGLTADTTYDGSQLTFNATAQEGTRTLSAEGSAVFHPDHQEIHLGTLALQSEQIRWQTPAGSKATIRYAPNRIAVANLRLVSGDQRIDADGVVGSPDETLRVHAENVDVAQLDQLFLGDQRLAGRLTADARVSGLTSALRAEGQFSLTQGAFRQFTFESFGGTVDYAGRGMNVDVRMQQTPTAWIAATGYAPVSLFRPNPPGDEEHEAPTVGEQVDLQISSSQIDLGVIQGVTSYVTDVTGALQANVKVSGSGGDPHLNGAIDIRGGAFAVPDLGTRYTGLDTRIDLTTDAVNISEMRIMDAHNNLMTIGGTLAVHERAVGAVDVKVQSRHFEVIDNRLASVNMDTDIRVTGELRAPRVVGSFDIDSGSVDVTRLIEQATADPYSTEATASDSTQAAAPAVASPFQALWDALELDLGVGVPSSLVLRGTNLRPVDTALDAGDINVTVGGAVRVTKSPGGTIRLMGEVNTVRGTYTFQGRRFEILRDGRIRFDGSEDIDPILDLRARRVISAVETIVRVQGTMTSPELVLSSNPPMDQAEILSLIVFNAPINELGEGQQVSLAERAAALAGGYLTQGLSASIGNALRLDEFEIQAQGDRGLGPTLSLGEQIGGRTYFRVRQGFGAEQATEFILEYQIADYLRLQGSVAEIAGGTQRVTFRRIERGGIDLIFFFSF